MTTDITELAQRMRIAATMASQGAWSYARSGFNSIVRTSANLPSGGASRVVLCKLFRSEWRGELKTAQDAQFIALANPANILALVEALEKAQRANAAQDDHINQQQDRIEQLEKGHQHAAKHINNWRRLAKQNIAEREKDISELEAARRRIAELESSVIAPGIMRCANCSFVLTKNSINMSAGTITAGDSKSEPCPNGCGPLWPVTWREKALQARDDSEQWFEDLQAAKARITELESRTITIEPFRSFVTDTDLAALHRFAECCDDPESGGHDLEIEQVRRLEAIGALQRKGRISYITGFGDVLISITAGIKWEAE